MKDQELECLPLWRYCSIPYGTKGPQYNSWQLKHYTLDQIPAGMNIGVLLGVASQGLCALDFDGPAAWDWWDHNINTAIPKTVSWASGREGRCQMAFQVPEAAWEYLKTRKINLDVPCPEDPKKMQGFELRWGDQTKGTQSVLPPSMHPNTKAEYFWVNPPSTTDIVPLPEAVLEYWIKLVFPEQLKESNNTYLPHLTSTDEVVQIYEELKKCYPRLEYDRWSIATWVVTRELGRLDGLAVMKHFWPPEKQNDYDILFKSQHQGNVCRLGTIIEWIRERNPAYKKCVWVSDEENSTQSFKAQARQFNRGSDEENSTQSLMAQARKFNRG